MGQSIAPTLWDNISSISAISRASHPPSSRASFDVAGMTPKKMVIAVLKKSPKTDEEMIEAIRHHFPESFGVSDQRLRTARKELEKQGLVYFAGMGRSAKGNPSRKHAAV